MRIHSGPGYRVYYGRTGERVYLLLCAGNDSTQRRDIERAIALFKQLIGTDDGFRQLKGAEGLFCAQRSPEPTPPTTHTKTD